MVACCLSCVATSPMVATRCGTTDIPDDRLGFLYDDPRTADLLRNRADLWFVVYVLLLLVVCSMVMIVVRFCYSLIAVACWLMFVVCFLFVVR